MTDGKSREKADRLYCKFQIKKTDKKSVQFASF
jgi:hypothetical protein